MKMLSTGVLRMMPFIMVWSIQGVGGKPKCDPEDHKYYHIQGDMCLHCDYCLQGEEAISLEDWNIEYSNPEKGPTECRPCRRCQPGTYSDKRSYKCEPCRNCTLFNQYQVSQCTATSNTVCDGVRPTTPRPIIISTPKPNHQDQKKGVKSPISDFIIAGIVCLTVFVISLLVTCICYFSRKKKLYQSGKNIESNQGVPGSSESDLNSDFRIDMEPEDEEPLVPQNSSCSQSHTKPLELEIRGTNPDQVDSHPVSLLPDHQDSLHDLETDGSSVESNQGVPGSSESDLNSDFRIDMEPEDEEPLVPQNSSCSQSHTKPLELEIRGTNPDQVDSHPVSPLPDHQDSLHDLETDGFSGINFSRRIRFDRQWSYPFDEKNKRDYHGAMQKDQPLTAIDQVSKDDVSVGYTETSSILELADKHLNRISKYLAVDNLFTEVARDLGMEEEDIKVVKIDCGKDNSIKETAYQMLLQIKKKRGKITLQELKSSLQNHDLGAWEKIHKVLHQTGSKEQ